MSKPNFQTAEDAVLFYANGGQEQKPAQPAPAVEETTNEEVTEDIAGATEEGENIEIVDESHTDSEEINDSETSEETDEANAEVDTEIDLDNIDDWDDSSDSTTEAPEFNFSEIGKALGNENIDSKDSLVEFVTSLNNEVKTLKEVSSQFEGVPEDLKKAIQIAKDKGDYKEYLGITATDFKNVDPKDLYEAQLLESGIFTKPDGTYDYDRLDSYLDSMSEDEINIRGASIRNELVARQESRKIEIEQNAVKRKAAETQALKETLDKTESVNGFKLKPSHKKQLFDGIATGKLFDKHYRKPDGSYDYKKVVENSFLLENREAIFNYLKTKSLNQGKKEMLDKHTNPDINTSHSMPKRSAPKAQSGIDLMIAEAQAHFERRK